MDRPIGLVEPRDHPFHRDEQVRIGRIVHATYAGAGACTSARIVAHPTGKPDEVNGEVFLAIDVPPRTQEPNAGLVYKRHAPQSAADMPKPGTWHWPRACPFDV